MTVALIHRKTRQVGLFLLFLAFFPGSPTWGGEAGKSARKAEDRDVQTRKIVLSLRIAEAKGKESSRRYFQSLLRHRKRKPFR